MRLRGGVLALVLCTACYRPVLERDCEVHCDHRALNPVCPGEMTCGTDDRCTGGAVCGDAGADDDGAVTADADGCPGLGFLHLCFPVTEPAHTVTGSTSFDTGLDCPTSLVVNGTFACLWSAASFDFTGTVTFIGPYPIVILATDSITVQPSALLDVSAGGAGANMGCQGSPDGIGGVNGDSVGGGAGGSLTSQGGSGGAKLGGTPAMAPFGETSTTVRGGCDGGRGGAINGIGGGAAGRGGGAIYLIAKNEIKVLGRIYAVGGGGGGGSPMQNGTGGGGGGGSGGQIILDAPAISLAGTTFLLAEGGGGGGGGAGAGSGGDGSPPNPAFTAPAMAGLGGTAGGAGGKGSYLVNLPGFGGGAPTSTGAGGGGGGGAGYIRFFSSQGVDTTAARIEPAPST